MDFIKRQLKKIANFFKSLAGKIFMALGIGTVALALTVGGFPPEDIPQKYVCDVNSLRSISVRAEIESRSAEERATIKGCEIAKIKSVPRTNVKLSGADYDIEIVEMKPIKNGVEVFARAWLPGGEQIGFGKDGTVDIERFVFINPPIMIPDGTTKFITSGFPARQVKVNNFKEDLRGAILQSLAQLAVVQGRKFGSESIIPNKIGNTTTTVYADNSGYLQVNNLANDWNTHHDATTAGTVSQDATLEYIGAGKFGAGSSDWVIKRSPFRFDTSGLPDTDNIDSAYLDIYVDASGVVDGDTTNPTKGYIAVVQPDGTVDPSALVDTDYNDIGDVDNPTKGSEDIDISNIDAATDEYLSVDGQQLDFNATGLGWISKTGNTDLALREGHDIEDVSTGSSSGEYEDVPYSGVGVGGTTQDPKLVVEHSAPAETKPRREIIQIKQEDLITFKHENPVQLAYE